jgi:hypothetical protein
MVICAIKLFLLFLLHLYQIKKPVLLQKSTKRLESKLFLFSAQVGINFPDEPGVLYSDLLSIFELN